ncbi:pentapeptide repeat-containing protein [Phormidium nigroviride]
MANLMWKLLTTDVRRLLSPEAVTETATGAIETTKATMDLAKILQEQGAKVPELANILTDSSTLLGVLNSPLAQIFKESLPFVNIAAKLLAYYLEKTKEEPTLAECIVIVSQAAYLQSFNDFLKQSADLLQSIGETPVSEEVKQQIEGLKELENTDEIIQEAKKTAVCFHDSKLAEKLNDVLLARLQQAGLAKNEADILTQRVAWDTHRYMLEAWDQSEVATKYFAKATVSEWLEQQEKYQSIDEYLQDEISPNSNVPEKLKRWQVFDEPFTISDIYVPLKAATVNDKGEIIRDEQHKIKEVFILQDQIKNILSDCQNPDDVIFIQAGPGRGKSVFCRKFADIVREHLHPIWTPILIRLRDLEHFDGSIDKILQNAINYDFAKNDKWLTDKNTRFLFLLDGFDELRIEGRDSGGLKEFIEKVDKFQKNLNNQGHRIILTGRQLALQGISYLPRMYRVEILAMDDEIQGFWFDKWEAIAAKYPEFAGYQNEVGKLRQLLNANNCPLQVKHELAREPLLLYLLGSLHRAGELKLEDFTNGEEIQTRIKIYEESLEMVLTKQRGEDVQKRLIALDPEDLGRILLEAALCVIQSGSEYAKIETIKNRLEADQGAKNLIDQLRQNSGEQGLTTALAAFYLKPAAGKKGGGVEFFHKSFSEFLFAKRLLESLEDWTKPGMNREKDYIPDNQFHQEIYDLLGYGALTWEILEYLIGLLSSTQNFPFVALFQRLEDFYQRWCEGQFIDIDPPNFPQQKWQKLKEELPEGLELLGQRQIDVYTGLNVMILLLELHRYGQQRDDLKAEVLFYPCGKPDTEGKPEYPDRLLYLIGYSCCLRITGFSNTVRRFLSGANLSGVNFSGANLIGIYLSGANLNGAYLSGANLNGAYLSGANLNGAYLSGANLNGAYLNSTCLNGANLSDANLSDANLSRANLSDADLSRANLSDADLSRANLSGANLSRANLSEIVFSEETIWDNVQGLETALNVPQSLINLN